VASSGSKNRPTDALRSEITGGSRPQFRTHVYVWPVNATYTHGFSRAFYFWRKSTRIFSSNLQQTTLPSK